MCMCVGALVCAGEHVHVCVCVWRPAVSVQCLPLLLQPYLLRQGLSMNTELTDLASKARCFAQGSARFCLLSFGNIGLHLMPGIYVGSGDLHSAPHAYVINVHLPSSLYYFLYFINFLQ